MLDRFIPLAVGMLSLSGPPGCNACILLMKVVLHWIITTVVIPNSTVLEKKKKYTISNDTYY